MRAQSEDEILDQLLAILNADTGSGPITYERSGVSTVLKTTRTRRGELTFDQDHEVFYSDESLKLLNDAILAHLGITREDLAQ